MGGQLQAEGAKMKCSRCGGGMEDRIVRFCVCELSPPLMVEKVPAKVCRRCGGEVFSSSTIKVFERIRDGQTLPGRNGRILVFDFDELTQPAPTNGHRQDRVSDPGTSGPVDFGSPQQMQRGPLVAASARTDSPYG